MKLFSGDKTGHVVTTEVDFYQGLCKSSLLLVEPPTEVIQLNYDHKVLLVSTKKRSFICRLDTTCQVTQIGQQDRKILGNFGACFVPGLCKTEDAMLYAARPGFRIWLSDLHGTVVNTHIFKDSLSTGIASDIPILFPCKTSNNPNAECQFGRLQIFQKHQLVTYNATSVFILDPRRNVVLASQSRFGGVVDVAVHGDELFVLRRNAEDTIVRIAVKPEVVSNSAFPLDIPVYASPATNSISAPMSSVTSKMVGVTTVVGSSTRNAETESTVAAEEENKAKTFLKKTFFTPFKKLENFVHEHKIVGKESQVFANASPFLRSAPDQPAPSVFNSSCRDSQGPPGSSDLPPVVTLHSPDLAVRVFTGGLQPGARSPVDIQSPDSADSALTAFALESPEQDGIDDGNRNEATTAPPMPTTETNTAGKGQNDIVFSHQMFKKKAKKKKAKGKDPDSVSQLSYSSQPSYSNQLSYSSQPSSDSQTGASQRDPTWSVAAGNEDDVADALRRADETLRSIDHLLNKDADHRPRIEADRRLGIELDNTCGDLLMPEQQHGGDTRVLNKETNSAGSKETNEQKFLPRVLTELAVEADLQVGMHSSVKPGSQGSEAPADIAPQRELERPKETDSVIETEVKHTGIVIPASAQTLPDSASAQCDGVHISAAAALSVKGISASPVTGGGSTASSSEKTDLAAADRSLDTLIQRRKVTGVDPNDDFYTNYESPLSPDYEPESPVFPKVDVHPLIQGGDGKAASVDRRDSATGSQEHRISAGEATLQRLANTWSAFSAPANIYSVALSDTHVWFTDKSENVYYSCLGGSKGIVWRKVDDSANQISVSPSGHIVWRLHRGRGYAGTKITQRHPEGMKSVEAVRDVTYISVDDTCAWFIKSSGDVMMQRGLCKERPCFRSVTVDSKHRIQQVMARYGVVWAITDAMKLLVRTGISAEIPHGTGWQEIDRHSEPFLFANVTVDNEGFACAADVLGQIWFTDAVTPRQPSGSGHWWQVPLSEYIMQDPSTLDMLRSLAKKFDPQKLSHILNTNRGGLIVAGKPGVWLSLDSLNNLYVCRGSLQGYYWSLAQPPKMAAASIWKQVCASVADLDWGMTWAQSANSELFAITLDSSDAVLVPAPFFVSFSVNEHAVWGLTSEGQIAIRTGMGAHCPLGVEWTHLNLDQLGDILLVHLSCNSSYIWVVDIDGQVFHRIGAAPLRPGQLNPVWLPIDTYSEIVFTKVVNGPQNWMVWAVDNRRLTYVREGVSEEMPIGREWVHVPGIQALDITVSTSGVWAVNTNGELYFRCGIGPANLTGDYWKRIPGCFTRISGSPRDVLWAINAEGQLMRCSTRHLYRRQDSSDPLVQRSTSIVGSDDGGWELV